MPANRQPTSHPPFARRPRSVLASATAAFVLVACANGGDSPDAAADPDTDALRGDDAAGAGDGRVLADGQLVIILPTSDGSVGASDGARGDGGSQPADAAPLEAGGPDAGVDATVDAADANAPLDARGGDAASFDAAPTDAPPAVEGGQSDASGAATDGATRDGAPESGLHDAAAEVGARDSASADSGTAACTLGHLVISQVESRGVAGGSDEFIDLYNPTTASVILDATWAIDARSTTSASFTSRWKGTSKAVPSLGHFLIVGSAYTGTPASDASLSTGVTDASSVRLTQNGSPVDVLCYAYNTSTSTALTADSSYDCPGTPALNPHNDTSATDVAASLERAPGGAAGNCVDTGSSVHDFIVDTPSLPENTSSPATP